MSEKVIPRRVRKEVILILDRQKRFSGEFADLKYYVQYLKTGAEDGWMVPSNKRYRAIVWLYETIKLLEHESKIVFINKGDEEDRYALQQENETLSAALNDARKEIRVLKNKLEVQHEAD